MAPAASESTGIRWSWRLGLFLFAQLPLHLVSVIGSFRDPQHLAAIVIKTLFQRHRLRAGARRNRCYGAIAHVAVKVISLDTVPSEFLTLTWNVPGLGIVAAETVALSVF